MAGTGRFKGRDSSPLVPRSLPLSGVRIMEMTNVIAGPVAGRLLADLGAEMVKFESLDGDISRPAGWAGFMSYNANKLSVSVNTRTDEGKDVARRLAATSDAILANMRPGATDRMGLDSATLNELNPGLVQSHVTAYGWDGPYSHRPGVDPIAQAITGLQHAQGGYGGPPVYLGVLAPCDYTGGALGALGNGPRPGGAGTTRGRPAGQHQPAGRRLPYVRGRLHELRGYDTQATARQRPVWDQPDASRVQRVRRLDCGSLRLSSEQICPGFQAPSRPNASSLT